MKIQKLLSNALILLMLHLNAGSAWAVENAGTSGSPYWPLIILLIVLFVFRKKLIAEATVQKQSVSHSDEEKLPQQKENKSMEHRDLDDVTDLTQNVEQCQGTTAKGTRCSRSANLEAVIVSIENKKYQFLSCKQHNNDDFTPFHFR